MSYGNTPHGSRSGGKGASPKKSYKKKKQEYHRHREQLQETEAPSIEQLRSRVMSALERLGHQRLSAEPGGYNLQSWVRNLDILLDDFEAKVGSSHLPQKYHEKREMAANGMLKSADSGEIDRRIETLRNEASEATKVLEDRRADIVKKLASIDSESNRLAAEVEEAQDEQKGPTSGGGSGSFLQRVFGRKERQSEDTKQKQVETESRLDALRTESTTLKADLERLDTPSGDSLAQRLSQIQAELAEAVTNRERLMQFSEERERLANEFISIISGISMEEKSDSAALGRESPGPDQTDPHS